MNSRQICRAFFFFLNYIITLQVQARPRWLNIYEEENKKKKKLTYPNMFSVLEKQEF